MTENNNLGELLPISENNGKKAVNARYLHSFLRVGKDFSTWIKGRINKYDFVEGKDFEPLYFDYQGNLLDIRLPQNGESENQKVSKIEYALSIGMAKELSMLENNERGKQARKYFIACEENKRELSRKELALMVIKAEEDKERLALENEKKQKQIERLKPKADFADKAFTMEGKVDIGQAAKKKHLFSFGILRNCRTFAVFTDDDCIRYVKQAVNLLISYMGFFYALIGYWRLPLRKIIVFALVANAPSVNSVKCNRFLFDKVAIYNFL